MLILEHSPPSEDVLDFIDTSIRNLQADGAEARYIIMGRGAFLLFREAVAERLGRDVRDFGTYNYISVIVDPFRDKEICVLPEPREIASGVETFTVPPA